MQEVGKDWTRWTRTSGKNRERAWRGESQKPRAPTVVPFTAGLTDSWEVPVTNYWDICWAEALGDTKSC